MHLDIKKAFTSSFSEDNWYLKWIFPVIMSGITCLLQPKISGFSSNILVILSIVSFIPFLVLSGFYFEFMHNEVYDKKPLLPVLDDNVIRYLSNGFLYVVVIFIYLFVLICLMLLSGLLHQLPVLLLILMILEITVALLLLFMAQGAYVDQFSIKDAINVPMLCKLILNAKSEFGLFVVISLFLNILSGIIVLITFKVHAFFVVMAIASVYVQFTNSNLIAQVYKIAKFNLKNPEKVEEA